MAAHRKPKQRSLIGSTARRARSARTTAVTLALAGAAGTTALEGTAQAEPTLTAAQIKSRIDTLYHDAEATTEAYNGVKEKSERTKRSLDALRDEAARRTERLNAARDALGALATAQYRSGGVEPALQVALTSDPDRYLERAALAGRAGDRQAVTVRGAQRQATEVARLRGTADRRFAELTAARAELQKHKAMIQGKIAEAEALLARLTAADRAAYAAQDGHGGTNGDRADRGARAGLPRGGTRAPNARAAQAVSFAYGALGKPYVWGATGPASFDCSGLTQAAWRSAGVALPRTTYTQINAGQRLSRSQLAPGDLLFFYSGITHVGLYIGDGKMIHAPRPGAPVRIAPIDEMPLTGMTRPA
ncbi:C40 family peptidase [Streptomyces candidus]|uniref:Cell wall-associated NlpC family hydrolase n=1 Tax=Streptomyces candidus TaxID=67283 RepID=A0A7X0HF27_9ACTN|nr:C40 family peptidase [Streptomyces candidus]MBB6434993.1 cell wall-associated NlpC family hydrolase [Streptomyces candidus]